MLQVTEFEQSQSEVQIEKKIRSLWRKIIGRVLGRISSSFPLKIYIYRSALFIILFLVQYS